MTIILWDEIDEYAHDPFYNQVLTPPPSKVSHLISIEIIEDLSNSVLVESIVQSIRKEVENMRPLLNGVGSTVSHDHLRTAGRFRLIFDDQGSDVDLRGNHHLRTYPAEEGPGLGQWTENFDWEVIHPDTCTPERQYDDLCPFIYEVNDAGRDAFGTPSDWPEPPFNLRVRHVVEEHASGPWGPAEFDVYIMIDEEEE